MNPSKYLVLLKSSGRSVFGPLSGSTPKFPTEYLSKLSSEGEIIEGRHHPSYEVLRAMLLPDVKGIDIEFSIGATQAYFQTMSVLRTEYNSIVIERPYYEPYLQILKNQNWKITFWDRSWNLDDDYRKLKFLSKNNQILMLTNPNFFNGFAFNSNVIAEISELFDYLVVDAVFAGQFNKANKITSEINSKNIFIINSLTKNFGLSNLRLGWVTGPKNIIKQVKEFSYILHGDLPVCSMKSAVAVLDKQQQILKHIKASYAPQKHALISELQQQNLIAKGSSLDGHFTAIKPIRHLRFFNEWGLSSKHFGIKGYFRLRFDVSQLVCDDFLKKIKEL